MRLTLRHVLFINQEERRARDTVLFTRENIDIANQSADAPFFTSEKNRMTNQLASLETILMLVQLTFST